MPSAFFTCHPVPSLVVFIRLFLVCVIECHVCVSPGPSPLNPFHKEGGPRSIRPLSTFSFCFPHSPVRHSTSVEASSSSTSFSHLYKISPHDSPLGSFARQLPLKRLPVTSIHFVFIASSLPSLSSLELYHDDAHTSSLYCRAATIFSTRARPCSRGTPLPWANTCA